MEAISLTDSARLVALEGAISRGLATFFEVGEALAEIRDSRLYKIEHATFEDYCETKWKMSKTSANRLIVSSKINETLTPVGVIPSSERQVRPLAKLPAEQQPAAWVAAVESAGGKQPTAKQVEAAVEVIRTPEKKPLESKPIAEPSKEATAARDWTEPQGVPDGLYSWAMGYAKNAITQLEKIQPDDINRLAALDKVAAWIEVNR
jgi:hypothetical protein